MSTPSSPDTALTEMAGDDDHCWREAARLRREHRAWLVIWLAPAREYRAYRRTSNARRETVLCADTPDALVAQIVQAERAASASRSGSRAGHA
jgi:hypothetical protein